jgi:hypothetical protein
MNEKRLEEILDFYKNLDEFEKSIMQDLFEQKTTKTTKNNTTPTRHKKYDLTTCKKACELRQNGKTYNEIKNALGISTGNIHRLILRYTNTKNGTVRRKKKHFHKLSYDDEQVRRATELHNQQVSNKDIARITGIKRTTLSTGYIWQRALKLANKLPNEL